MVGDVCVKHDVVGKMVVSKLVVCCWLLGICLWSSGRVGNGIEKRVKVTPLLRWKSIHGCRIYKRGAW